MTWRAAMVLALALAGCDCAPVPFFFGHDDAGDGGSPDSGTPDAGPCGGCGGVAGLRCDQDAGACVECLSDLDCAAPHPACEPATGRCVECVGATQCSGSGKACDPLAHRCGVACTPPLGAECAVLGFFHGCTTSNLCQTCDSDDCRRDGGLCDARVGRCVECSSDADCAAPRAKCDLTRGQCAGCLVSADCGAAQVCDPAALQCAP